MSRILMIGVMLFLFGIVYMTVNPIQAEPAYGNEVVSLKPLLTPPCEPPLCNPPPPPPPPPVTTETPTPTPTRFPTGTPSAPPPDETILEVSQGIQNKANDMPLIANRPTIVRAYPGHNEQDYFFKKAILKATRNGIDLSPAQIEENNYNFLAEIDRNNLNDTLWFVLPPQWLSGNVQLTLTIEYGDWKDPAKELKQDTVIDLSFLPARIQYVVAVPLHMHNQGNPANPALDPGPGEGQAMIQAAIRYLPTHKIHIMPRNLFYPKGHAALPNHGPSSAEWNLLTPEGQEKLRQDLTKLFEEEKLDASFPGILYLGLVEPDVSTFFPSTGSTLEGQWLGGSVLWFKNYTPNEDPPEAFYWSSASTVAHEVSHTFGFSHIYCNGDEVGLDLDYPWPRTDSQPCRLAEEDPDGFFGLDVYNNTFYYNSFIPWVISNEPGYTAFPLLGYREPTWISPYEFCRLMPLFGVPCSLSWPPPQTDSQVNPESGNDLQPRLPGGMWFVNLMPEALPTTPPFLTVQGWVDLDTGTGEVSRLNKIDALPGMDEPPVLSSYQLVLRDSNGDALDSQYLTLDQPFEGSLPAGFYAAFTYPAGLASIELLKDGALLAEKTASLNPPTVTLLSPNSGPLTPGTQIEWSGSDLDGDDLLYDLFYTRDSGQTWTALVMGAAETSFLLPSLDGLGGSNQGQLRVKVSDGFLTAEDLSDGDLTLPNQPPSVMILNESPNGAVVFIPGDPVMLTANAGDLEDGPLFGTSLVWSSDVDGILAEGDLLLANLTPGEHVITVTTTDANGQTSSDSIIVKSANQVFMPCISR